jgi:hypothetical protein
MQTVRKMDKVVIEDYCHMTTTMTTMDENVYWMKRRHRFPNSALNFRAPFVHLPLLQKKSNTLFKWTYHTKMIPLPYVYYVC